MNKMNIYELLVDKNEDKIVIGIDKTISLGSEIDELSNFKNIRYLGTTIIVNPEDNKQLEVHKIEFQNTNDMIFELITKHIFKFITQTDDSHTIYEILMRINDYFSCINEYKKLVKKLLGDIAEILFILLLQENNIDYRDHYQKTSNSLYDFYFDNFCVDVKAISSKKKTLKTSWRQITTVPQIYYYCFEISKLQNASNIFSLINLIINKNDYIKELENEWKIIYEFNKTIIDSWTIDRQNIKHYLLNNAALPKISIIEENGLRELLLEVDISNVKNENMNDLIMKIKNHQS